MVLEEKVQAVSNRYSNSCSEENNLQIIINWLEKGDDNPGEKKTPKKEKTPDGEVEDSERGDEDLTQDVITVAYSSPEEEQFLAEQFYRNDAIDYLKLFNGEQKNISSFKNEEEYFSAMFALNDTRSGTMNDEEAVKTFVSIQYAVVMGNSQEISSVEREQFDMWIKFNEHVFHMLELMYAVTREVNYRPLTR